MLRGIFMLLLVTAYTVNCQNENSYFVNSALLNTNVALSWNYTTEEIIFKIVANTLGWVGFGLSPNGGMENSDVMLTWTGTDGTVQFKDAHVESSKSVLYDTVQNWMKIFYRNQNSQTIVIFKRKLNVCNEIGLAVATEIDIQVLPTSYVIYAWGIVFNSDGTPNYHGPQNRGSRFLPLLASLNREVTLDMTQITTYDYRVNTTLPNDRTTTYFCQMFKLPNEILAEKHNVVRMETIVSPENLKYVHHWLMYECDLTYETEYLVNNTLPSPGICSDGSRPEWNAPGIYCKKISLAWATGGDLKQDFPKDFGYPIGGSGGTKYFYLQMHYENTAKTQNVKEDSGMRIYTTKNIQPTQFGVFTMGTYSQPQGLIIPPKMKKLTYRLNCRQDALNALFENGDITVFAQIPHTHLSGVEVFSTVVRNNSEMNYISNNKYYDSEFQYVNYLQTPITMKSGDALSLSCSYSTNDRDATTFGGLGTFDEMCLNFIWYYPYNPKIDACYDAITNAKWYEWFYTLNQTGQINWVLSDPVSFNNFFEDSLKSIETSSMTPDQIETSLQNFIDTSEREQSTSGLNPIFLKDLPAVTGTEKLGDVSCKATQTTSTTTSTTTSSATKMNFGLHTAFSLFLSLILTSIYLLLVTL